MGVNVVVGTGTTAEVRAVAGVSGSGLLLASPLQHDQKQGALVRPLPAKKNKASQVRKFLPKRLKSGLKVVQGLPCYTRDLFEEAVHGWYASKGFCLLGAEFSALQELFRNPQVRPLK